jgi:hypothetical protein
VFDVAGAFGAFDGVSREQTVLERLLLPGRARAVLTKLFSPDQAAIRVDRVHRQEEETVHLTAAATRQSAKLSSLSSTLAASAQPIRKHRGGFSLRRRCDHHPPQDATIRLQSSLGATDEVEHTHHLGHEVGPILPDERA